jgi:hypothetical protein
MSGGLVECDAVVFLLRLFDLLPVPCFDVRDAGVLFMK